MIFKHTFCERPNIDFLAFLCNAPYLGKGFISVLPQFLRSLNVFDVDKFQTSLRYSDR